MRERYYAALSAVMYSLCAVLLICLIWADFILTANSHTVKIITTFLIFIFGFLGSYFLKVRTESLEKKKKITFFTSIMLFAVYIIILIDFTLIDGSFGRSISNFFALSGVEKAAYLEENTNLIPFATVKLFINGYSGGHLSLLSIIENLIGNLVGFMPFAYFVPILFKKINRALPFFITVLITVLFIEILQIIFLTGSADIDDLILNTAGAMIVFLLRKKMNKL